MSIENKKILSDKKIIERLNYICEIFYKVNSNVSKNIIDKTIKLINFVEHCSKNAISIKNEVVSDIMNYINKIETYIKNFKLEKSKGVAI